MKGITSHPALTQFTQSVSKPFLYFSFSVVTIYFCRTEWFKNLMYTLLCKRKSVQALLLSSSAIIYDLFSCGIRYAIKVCTWWCVTLHCSQECVWGSNRVRNGIFESRCLWIDLSQPRITQRHTGTWCSSTFPAVFVTKASQHICRRAAERELRIEEELLVMWLHERQFMSFGILSQERGKHSLFATDTISSCDFFKLLQRCDW